MSDRSQGSCCVVERAARNLLAGDARFDAIARDWSALRHHLECRGKELSDEDVEMQLVSRLKAALSAFPGSERLT